jgi:ribosomal-protein-alanine N-acetyltransferase
VRDGVSETCEFRTERLRVGPWHVAADRSGVDLADAIMEILTFRTTVALPESWRGDYSVERAGAWISERDAESATLLLTEIGSRRPVGLVILAEAPLGESAVDVRLGYVIAEGAWGRGLASEFLKGLSDWARSQPTVHTLTGGLDPANQASVRVLEKAGFTRISDQDDSTATYQLDLHRATHGISTQKDGTPTRHRARRPKHDATDRPRPTTARPEN